MGFDGAIVVGSGDQCNLVLRSRGVSSSHCRLTPVPGLGGAYMLEDLRSSYGTLVNGRRVAKPVVVSDRDIVLVGEHRLVVVGQGGDAAAFARLQGPAEQPPATAAPPSTPSTSSHPDPVSEQLAAETPWIDKYEYFDAVARAWHDAGRPRTALLKGNAIRVAEAYLAAGAHKRPAPEAIHHEFVAHSRRGRSSKIRLGVLAGIGGVALLGVGGVGVRYGDEIRELLGSDTTSAIVPPTTGGEPGVTEPDAPPPRDISALAKKSLTLPDANVRLLMQAGVAGDIVGQRDPLASGAGWDVFASVHDTLASMNETALAGHAQAITAVDVGPTGRFVVSGSADNSARLWDLSKPAPTVSTTFRGHMGPVTAVAISPDGTMLLTASEDNDVRRWDLLADDPGATATLLQLHDSEITHLVWHPNGQTAVSADLSGVLRTWNMRAPDPAATSKRHVAHTASISGLRFSGERLYSASDDRIARRYTIDPDGNLKRTLRFEAHIGGIASLALSDDGRYVATGGTDGEVYLWDQKAKRPGVFAAALLGHEDAVNGLAFSPDNGRLVTASDDDTLRVWNLRAKDPSVGSVVLPGHTGDITSVQIIAEGSKAVSTSLDNTIRVWDLDKSDRIVDQYPLVGHQGPVTAFELSPDHLWAASGSDDGKLRVWDLLSKTPGRGATLLRLGARTVYDVALAPTGDRVVAVGADGGVALWDLQRPARVPQPTRLAGLSGLITAVAYDPKGRYIATAGDDGQVQLWRLGVTTPTPETLGTPELGHHGPVNALAFTPDGDRLLSVSSDRTVMAWTPDGSAPPEQWSGHRDEVHLLAISSAGDYAFSAGVDGAILRWPLADGHRGTAGEFKGHEGEVLALRLSEDGTRLASASADRRAHLWDVATGTSTYTFRGHDEPVTAVALGANQTLATGARDGKIFVWDLASDHPDESPRSLLGHVKSVNDLVFTAGGELVVSSGNDGTVRVWRVATGASTQLTGHDGPVSRVLVGPRGETVLSSSYDGTVRVWPMGPEAMQWRICDAVGEPVDPPTWNTFFGTPAPPRVCARPQ